MSNAADPARGWQPPKEFEEYRIVRELGRGTMGQVFLAHDLLLDRAVAVKFLAGVEPAPALRSRFFLEARAIARLQHPNIATVYRVGELRQRPYLVSEYIRGNSLDRIARPLPWTRALQIGLSIARGLAAAHRMQVLHRDLKPANVMIAENGEAKLVDFGLAELLDGPTTTATDDLPLPAARASNDALEETLDLGVPPVPTQPVASAASNAPRRGDRAGTPAYMAPEVWAGEAASRQTDVYAAGVVLYELCSGIVPIRRDSVEALARAVREEKPRPLIEVAPDVDPAFAAVVDACLAKDPEARPASGDALRDALEELLARTRSVVVPEGNPYRGLLTFGAEHRSFFFGRASETRAVLDRLRADSWVLVAGDSGVGKSSLCRAGVLPAIADGALGPVRPDALVTVVPGRHPVQSLAAALAPLLREDEGSVAQRLFDQPQDIARALRRLGPGLGCVLLVDQLEELWTLSVPVERERTLDLLSALTLRSSPVRLLATIRSDFLTRVAATATIGEGLSTALYVLRPIPPENVRRIVTGPAEVKGFRFQSEAVVEALADAARQSSSSLPLLQFALAELWEARDAEQRIIPTAALERIGGVAAALARHADSVVGRLLPDERAAAVRILTSLVTPEGTRARRSERDLAIAGPAARVALEALVRGRLVLACEGEAEHANAYEIAHESLLTGWDTLRGWLGRDAEKRALRQRLARAAVEWDRLGRGREGLLAPRQLQELAAVGEAELDARERSLIAASRRQASRARRARVALVAVVPIVALAFITGTRMKAHAELSAAVQAQMQAAERALSTAESEATLAEGDRAAAFSRFTAGDLEAGEVHWASASGRMSIANAAYRDAGRALEAALLLEPDRADVRARFADLLAGQLIQAERALRFDDAVELRERLRAWDPGGVRFAHLDAPVRLSLRTTPPGAHVVAWKYGGDGRIQGEPASLGATPLRNVEVAQGSWLLEVSGAGTARVRIPVFATRGVDLALETALPRAQSIPHGFVFIPGGEYLAGSADPEEVRRGFFGAPPLHRSSTEAYLIARTEVTFREWIEFLRDLPAEQRAVRLPRARRGQSAIRLHELSAGHFELRITPAGHEYVAREGEPIVYPARSHRQSQDWQQFPVSGISWSDALAYTTWLHQTRRVNGARPCSEREWERAARGADGRPFPAGTLLSPDDANVDVTYGRLPLAFGPDEVGAHAASDSPFGVSDLAGNVWEMTQPHLGGPGVTIRGGSWYHGDLTARSVNREHVEPTMRDPLIGFRVCAAATAASQSVAR